MNELPESLRRYEGGLRDAVGRDRRRSVRRRRGTRAGVVGIVGSAVALAALTLPGGGESTLARAAAALQAPQGTILHSEMTGRQVESDGSVATWRDERWQLIGGTGDSRQVETAPDGTRTEAAVASGELQMYDAAADTIYLGGSKADVEKAAGGKDDTVKQGDENAARKLREGLAKKQAAEPRAKEVDVEGDPFRAKMLALLAAGKAREDGHAVIDGRDAIRLVLDEEHATYLVDARTFAPIEYTTRGNGGSVTQRFTVYEKLPATDANLALLSLRAQHPDARIDSDSAHFRAASTRLFPHG